MFEVASLNKLCIIIIIIIIIICLTLMSGNYIYIHEFFFWYIKLQQFCDYTLRYT